MSKFYYEDYDETYVMHCPTKESAQIFLKHLDSLGKRWWGGMPYTASTEWYQHKTNTCYRFYADIYDSIKFYTSKDCKRCLGFSANVLEFDDFEWDDCESEVIEVDMPFEELIHM